VGKRANVAIRQNGTWTHRGSNGMGYSLDQWMILGPDAALAVMNGHPVWVPGEWNGEYWCEAGALIDLDLRELLYFNTDDYAWRAAVLDGLRRTWTGWTIRPAYDGIADITDALGLERAVIGRSGWDSEMLFPYGSEPEEKIHYLVTVGESAYAVGASAQQPWRLGPRLLDQVVNQPLVRTLDGLPRGGVHVDADSRTVGVWSTEPMCGFSERFAGLWPGWMLMFWEDRYQEQQARCGSFRFPNPDPQVRVCRAELVRSTIRQWIFQTVELVAVRGPMVFDYGMSAAGLTVADLQRLGEAILGTDSDTQYTPERDAYWMRPLDVAALAQRCAGES
jgi:hypothetical protein